MNKYLQNDSDNLEVILETIKNQSLAYLTNITERPTSNKNIELSKDNLAENGIGTLETLAHFNKKYEPIMVSSSGPRYWGYVIGGTTPASIAGDWLTAIYDQCTFAIKGQGDISANIEPEAMNMMLDLFDLPKDFIGGGCFGSHSIKLYLFGRSKTMVW